MNFAPELYRYRALLPGPDSIRLLRLLPSENEASPIQCRLFNYSIHDSGSNRTHPYDALSYVWGKPDQSLLTKIFIDKQELPVTPNLHDALLRLRHHYIERILWVDAICINQGDVKEKEQQIRFMAKIYGVANRVVVWLGEAADNSDEALEEIRAANDKISTVPSRIAQQAIPMLLQRPWFRRIWVLQEVAAARHILLICGSTDIDGYAFCLGIDSLRAHMDLPNSIRSVTYLMKGAIFRPKYVSNGSTSLEICPLGELIDMYHAHGATQRHDKVYALLGMSSDDIDMTNLLPDYGVPWEQLFQRLVKFLQGDKIFVETWSDRGIAVIKSKGCILGRVSSVRNDVESIGGQVVDIAFIATSGESESEGHSSSSWTLQPSANPIVHGDLLCLLQGASQHMIVRPCKDHFIVIMVAATPLQSLKSGSRSTESSRVSTHSQLFSYKFLLIWNWETSSSKLQFLEENKVLMQQSNCATEDAAAEVEYYMEKATRMWNVALILKAVGEENEAQERIEKAQEVYMKVAEEQYPQRPQSQFFDDHGQTPLSWAAGNGYLSIVKFLLAKNGVDRIDDLKEGNPLSQAVEGGHEAVVMLLLKTGKLDFHFRLISTNQSLLSWAAEKGHEAVVKLLSATDQVDIDWEDYRERTPLLSAAMNGHEAIVKLLIETGKVNVNFTNSWPFYAGRTPLSYAAEKGFVGIVKLLVDMGKAEVNGDVPKSLLGMFAETPLAYAARNGHEEVVKLLQSRGGRQTLSELGTSIIQ